MKINLKNGSFCGHYLEINRSKNYIFFIVIYNYKSNRVLVYFVCISELMSGDLCYEINCLRNGMIVDFVLNIIFYKQLDIQMDCLYNDIWCHFLRPNYN